MLTKGAMKVYDSLKVSIPTEELNMSLLLDRNLLKAVKGKPKKNPTIKNTSTHKSQKINKSKKNLKNAIVRKRNGIENSACYIGLSSKSHDVYDFEETQDNSEVFIKPDFKRFRNQIEEIKNVDKNPDRVVDSKDHLDSLGLQILPSDTPSVSDLPTKKSNKQENITKKKCMIMGRIFKNSAKPQIEDLRDIAEADNAKLVEDFVSNCVDPMTEKPLVPKPMMTPEELDLAFDRLVNGEPHVMRKQENLTVSSSVGKLDKVVSKRRTKTKTKKRSNDNSDSSDDEFNIIKSLRRRSNKKNVKTEDNCINLEQELKECMGVASRKSQRKCTSGKQNVLVEYWSSDESIFEALIGSQANISESIRNDNISNQIAVELLPAPKEIAKSEALESMDKSDNIIPQKEAENNKRTENIAPKNTEGTASKKVENLKVIDPLSVVSSNRRKRAAANPLYHWSSSSEDESCDLIEIKPIRDEIYNDGDRPIQHGWIVGDSPKKLVTMLAQAKGKKFDADGVKEQVRKRTHQFS